ncbi:blue copper protein-like [Oryza brachyantha]|uniref:blue copper protein-like n=1 Tax=Oryza brachyantha TaxID=4533 RepID=UPI001ADC43F5|nr:blue copper protein-like [Oryza brachyantha]
MQCSAAADRSWRRSELPRYIDHHPQLMCSMRPSNNRRAIVASTHAQIMIDRYKLASAQSIDRGLCCQGTSLSLTLSSAVRIASSMESARAPAMAMAAAMLAAVVLAQAPAAGATIYTVGAPDGLWDMETDYNEWVGRRSFHPGDKLTFTYSKELHDVVEVTKAGYDACSNANNISAFRSGNDVVALSAVGTRYFLCGLTGHCDSGMKIRIDVVAAAGAPGPVAGGPGAAPPLPSTSSSTPSPSAAAAAAGSLVLVLVYGLLPLW